MRQIDYLKKVSDAALSSAGGNWRKMIPCDTPSGDMDVINQCVADNYPEKLIYAEGDSWFDKFTPIPNSRTNLLQEIRLPFKAAVVDVSTVGDESGDMVKGWQRWRTETLFKFYRFDAILLSAGGNDLKNLYADKLRQIKDGGVTPAEIADMCRPATYQDYFDRVIKNIKEFVALRNNAGNDITRRAPILLHGYDYIQPRPAKAEIFSGGSLGRGPWLYPMLFGAGFTSEQMRSAADAVVDQLNKMLKDEIRTLANVYAVDSRGVLNPAAQDSTGESEHWLDEIHPNGAGFKKLASFCWNQPLATLLGYQFAPHELDDVGKPVTLSQALANNPTIVTA